MERTIQSDLFRFVTLRGPQLLSEEQKANGFVSHPELSESQLYLAAQTANTNPLAEAPIVSNPNNELAEGSDGPHPVQASLLTSKAQLRQLNPALYSFAHWLGKNKNGRFSPNQLLPHIAGAVILSDNDLLLVWESLFGETKQQKNTPLREALILVLVAHQFLQRLNQFRAHYPEELSVPYQDFAITANAKVVIPKELLGVKVPSPSAASRYVDDGQADSTQKALQHTVLMQRYEAAVEELRQLNRTWLAETAAAYQAAQATHEAAVREAYKDAVKETDPITGQVRYPDLVLPKFEFVAPNPISEDYFEQRLSLPALEIISRLRLNQYNSLAELLNRVESDMQQAGSYFFSHPTPTQNVVVYRGNAVETNIMRNIPHDPLNTLYGFNVCSVMELSANGSQRWRFTLTLNAGFAYPLITDAAYTALYNETESPIQMAFTPIESSGMILKIGLFNDGLTIQPTIKSVRLKGTLTLANGTTLSFDVTVMANSCTPGVATPSIIAEGGDETAALVGIHQVGIADYRKVVQEVCCYVPGEVSHIENVLKGEYKERATRRLRRSENTLETSAERETENLTDTSSTERNELHNEVSRVLSKDQSITANASVGGSISKLVNFNVAAGYASNTSQSDSASQAVSYAKDVTARAMDRVVQKISEKRTTKMIDEFEESNKHGFDNRGEGAQNISGVYRWIDKIYKNQVVNYGRRLMYEIMVPEPARFLTKAPAAAASNGSLQVLQKPIDPRTIVADAGKLTAANYQSLAAMYNAAVAPCPHSILEIAKAIKMDGTGKSAAMSVDVELPDGYMATDAYGSYAYMFDPGAQEFSGYAINIGKYQHHNTNIYGDNVKLLLTPIGNIEKKVAIGVNCSDIGAFSGSIVFVCQLTEAGKRQWQDEAFKAILDAYEEKLQQYERALAEAVDKTAAASAAPNGTQYNPLHSRTIEMTELKKNCLQLMLEPYGHPIGVKTIRPNGHININGSLSAHGNKVRFFEAAFEWEVMSYIFYPYYWADEAEWANKFGQEDGDPLFRAFLQAGMGKVLLSVRPGFEEAVLYYLATGQIADGKGLAMDDELYLSLLAEQLPIEGQPEGEPWETRLPTSLTVLQQDSIAVDEEGLPCFCDEGNNITSNTGGLKGKE
jgi:hypothetical protein